MVRSTASTRQPPAGDPKATIQLDELLTELRRGGRDAFVHYFRLFRAPVYHFAWRLLRDEETAASATAEALVGAFRRAVLGEGPDDLEVLTYRSALEACGSREASSPVAPAAADEAGPTPGARGRHVRDGGMARRFEAALESLDTLSLAVLLLHDVPGLDAARSAAVLRIREEAAGALLYRAREKFRAALGAQESTIPDATCRQAEEAAAGAVGLGLTADELSRLQRHAAYCRPCRRVLKGWSGVGLGLGAVLAAPSLPEALATTPVFADAAVPLAAASALPGLVPRAVTRTGRVLRGRALAWTVAAASLALVAGVVIHGVGPHSSVLWQSVGPAIRLVDAPPAAAAVTGAGHQVRRQPAPSAADSGASDAGTPAGAATAGGERASEPIAVSPRADSTVNPQIDAESGRTRPGKARGRAARANARGHGARSKSHGRASRATPSGRARHGAHTARRHASHGSRGAGQAARHGARPRAKSPPGRSAAKKHGRGHGRGKSR
jgi:DNA-directed RNA polymerase specialized sigma24 family protein